ncbi:MAG: T9SS type A sorting domain-containing protein [candidate division KSB1 bacterium]|nr:T9SS type A sorting domain-containing protein [candidate division KSB1 bacterium]MDZ7369250.1 T9SS type A sorting domain-containing protein [candidate division KSB1 bacterium]
MKLVKIFSRLTLCLLLGAQGALAQNDFWRQTDGPFGGDIRAFAIDSAGYIFTGTFGAGIFRSTDNGENWSAVNTGLTNKTVLALAMNPATGNIIAGTGSFFLSTPVNGAVFRSTNSGASWEKILDLSNTVVLSLASNSQGHIFAGTLGRGVFRSTTNGASWDSVNAGLTQSAFKTIRALAIHQATGEVFAATDSSGLFRLPPSSNTWERITIGLQQDENIRSLIIRNNGYFFAGTQYSSNALRGRLLRSADGTTWGEVGNGLVGREIITLATNSKGDIFAGTGGFLWSVIGRIFRSTDNGENWTEPDPSFKNPGVQCLAVNASDEIFAGTLGSGVFRSNDQGGSWQASNHGLLGVAIQALALNSSGQIFAGTSGAGIFRGIDVAGNWQPINSGLGNYQVTTLAISTNNQIFAGSAYAGVFRSDDNGETWQARNTGLTGPGVVALATRSNGDVFAGTGNVLSGKNGGVFRLTGNNQNWTRVLNLPENLVLSLALNTNGHVFAGTNGAGIFRATTNDTVWNPVNVGLTNKDVRALAIHAATQEIFAGTAGGGVFRSTDNGDNWVAVNAGLTNKNIRALAISANGVIWAGTAGGGVFYSLDSGTRWNVLNNGLTDKQVLALAIDSSRYVYAGTEGGGVFRSLESTIVPPAVPTLASPADGAVNQPPILTLRWNAAAAAETYHLQVATSSSFATPIVDDSTITTTFRQVGPLPFNTTYYWRVNAKNIAGPSNWSSVWRFTTTAQTTSREVRVVNTNASPGSTVEVPIQLLAQGDENALGFSLNFDTAILSNPQARRGKDASAATLNTNSSQVGSGRFGIALALPAGQSFAAGTREIVIVSFTVNANTTADSARIEFGGQPVVQEVVDASGNVLAATWTAGRVRIETPTSVKETTGEVPSSFALKQNSPNPFNPSTTIKYELPQQVEVKLVIFDLMGRRVRTLVDQRQQSGRYAITWDGRNEQGEVVTSGVYLYQLHAGNFVQTRRMALVR